MNRINVLSLVVENLENMYDKFKLESAVIDADGTGTGSIILPNEKTVSFIIKANPTSLEIKDM